MSTEPWRSPMKERAEDLLRDFVSRADELLQTQERMNGNLARVRALREQNLLFADRERIARDLHDLVIQRLFASGLSIQSLRRYTLDPVAHERIAAVTSELDDTIRKLRDTMPVRENVAGHLLSVLSEGLSNAARHSGAQEIRVSVSVTRKQVELVIEDDGSGFEKPDRISGLANMRHRAELLGGTCGIDSAPGEGTRISWSANCQ